MKTMMRRRCTTRTLLAVIVVVSVVSATATPPTTTKPNGDAVVSAFAAAFSAPLPRRPSIRGGDSVLLPGTTGRGYDDGRRRRRTRRRRARESKDGGLFVPPRCVRLYVGERDEEDAPFASTANADADAYAYADRDGNSSRSEEKDRSDLLDLIPPLVNLRRRSMLFEDGERGWDRYGAGANARSRSSDDDDPASILWRRASAILPFVLTGSRKDEGGTAAGRIYNMIFVRAPIIAAGLGYGVNLAGGHPLVVDVGLGGGPFAVPPPFVLIALWAILR